MLQEIRRLPGLTFKARDTTEDVKYYCCCLKAQSHFHKWKHPPLCLFLPEQPHPTKPPPPRLTVIKLEANLALPSEVHLGITENVGRWGKENDDILSLLLLHMHLKILGLIFEYGIHKKIDTLDTYKKKKGGRYLV